MHGGAGRVLEEATVLAEDLRRGVAGKRGEGIGDIDYRVVRNCERAEEEGAGGVDEAEVESRVGTLVDTNQDTEHIKATGRIETWIDHRVILLFPRSGA